MTLDKIVKALDFFGFQPYGYMMHDRHDATTVEAGMRPGRFVSNDRYQKLSGMAASSQGMCSLIKSRTTGQVFVVKRIHHSPANMDKSGYFREPRMLLAYLQPHPNLVYCFEAKVGVTSECNLLLEHCSGGDLREQTNHWIRMRMLPPTAFTLHAFVEISRAFAYIHHGLRFDGCRSWTRDPNHKPVIHGDLKPENIFLRWSNRNRDGLPDVVLGDFGLSSIASEVEGVVGTPGWEAPEVVALKRYLRDRSGRRDEAPPQTKMTTASDIYSFGLMIYYLANQAYVQWDITRDVRGMVLPRAFNDSSMRLMLSEFLQPQPTKRATADFDRDTGFLSLLDGFAHRRNRWAKLDDLDRRIWRQPSP